MSYKALGALLMLIGRRRFTILNTIDPITCNGDGCVAQEAMRQRQEKQMIKYAIIFALISLIAGALGFGGVAAGAAGIAKILFGLFLILAVIFVVLAALGVGAVKKAIK